MVFNVRKIKKTTTKKLFSFNYLKRSTLFYFLKLVRVKDKVDALAIGFACGAMVSFTPFIGFHFLLAIAFAFVLRGNIIASLIGTFIGNPFTFPFIWILIYRIGSIFFENNNELVFTFTFESLLDKGFEILIPMLIGSIILALPVWITSFFLVKFLILSFKKRKV